MTTDKQQLWWRRGNNGTATNSKQQSTNAHHAQQRIRDNGRMRWRTTAAEEMRWTVGSGGATTALTTMTKTTINKCAAAKADNDKR
jgi:hypothetical protein